MGQRLLPLLRSRDNQEMFHVEHLRKTAEVMVVQRVRTYSSEKSSAVNQFLAEWSAEVWAGLAYSPNGISLKSVIAGSHLRVSRKTLHPAMCWSRESGTL